MRKFWLIFSGVLTIATLIYAYARRFIGKISFDVDLEIKLVAVSEDFIVMPLIIFIDNRNKKGLTVKDLRIKIYDSDNILIAETYTPINQYTIQGYKNNKITHDFTLYTKDSLIKVIKDKIEGKKTTVYIVASFNVFSVIPISKREEIEI